MERVHKKEDQRKVTDQVMSPVQMARVMGNQAVVQRMFYDIPGKPLTEHQKEWNQIRDRVNNNPSFFENVDELNNTLDELEGTVIDIHLITIISMSIRANIKKISEIFDPNEYGWKDIKKLFGKIGNFLNVQYTEKPGMKGHPGINYSLTFHTVTVEAFVPSSTHGKTTGNLHSAQGNISQSLTQIDALMVNYILGS